MKWTLDKELEDTAKATAGGYSMGRRRSPSAVETPDPDASNPANPNGMTNAQATSGLKYKRGGSVPFSPPMGGAIGTARAQPKPSRADAGVATIGVTRSNRSYPKGK